MKVFPGGVEEEKEENEDKDMEEKEMERRMVLVGSCHPSVLHHDLLPSHQLTRLLCKKHDAERHSLVWG